MMHTHAFFFLSPKKGQQKKKEKEEESEKEKDKQKQKKRQRKQEREKEKRRVWSVSQPQRNQPGCQKRFVGVNIHSQMREP